MTVESLLNTTAAIAIAAVFVYWQLREQTASSTADLSGHRRPVRLLIRLLMPAIAVLVLLQLAGLVQTSAHLPSGLNNTFFTFGHVAFWSGVILAIWARETLGKNWAHAANYQIIPHQSLIVHGPYRYIRHPIYAGMLAMFVGVELALSSWLIVLAIPFGWFARWQAMKEEQILLATFGQSYQNYQRRTGMFLPRLIQT